MQKPYNTGPSRGHSLIELMICCVLVFVVMLGIGAGMVYVFKQDTADKDRAEMMEDMTLALGIIGDRLSLATNIIVTPEGGDSVTNITAYFSAGGAAFDTNQFACVQRYDVLWTITNDLRQVVSSNTVMGAMTNTLISVLSANTLRDIRTSRTITSFTCLTNIPRSVQLSMCMQKVTIRGGRQVTNSAVLSNIWVNLWGTP